MFIRDIFSILTFVVGIVLFINAFTFVPYILNIEDSSVKTILSVLYFAVFCAFGITFNRSVEIFKAILVKDEKNDKQ